MPRAKATDGLSAAGQAAMARGFAAGWTAERVARAVKDETGEAVKARTVARRASEWRAETERRRLGRERMSDLVEAMKSGGMEASEMVQALAMDHLVEHPEALTGADPVELQGMSLDAERVRLKRREIEIRERELLVKDRRVKLLEDRDARVRAAVEAPETATPEERLRKVREILGLGEAA